MYLALDTKFNPFTYAEMVQPLLYYKEAYDKTEAAYSDLAAQTELWKDVVKQHESPKAYSMFKSYSDRLNAAVDDFSKGMTAGNRRPLVGLKRDYSRSIVPIANAYKRKEALADEQRKAELSNPTMMWEKRADSMSIDDFIKDPSASYGKSFSGTTLTAQVSAAAANLAKQFRDNPDDMKELVGGDYFKFIQSRGYSSQAILAAILDNKEASPELTRIIENVIDSSGIREWENPEALQQAYNYARQGLWSAIGQDEAQYVQNWRAHENLQHSHAMSRQAAAHQQELEKAYLTQTAQPYLKEDGSVGYYEPIAKTRNANGSYSYSRNAVPTDAKKGNPRADSKSGSGTSAISQVADYTETDAQGNPVSQLGKLKSKGDITTRILTNTGITAADVLGDNATKELKNLKKLGFRILKVIGRHNNGELEIGDPGTDFGDGMVVQSKLVNGVKEPLLVDPSDLSKGYQMKRSTQDPNFGFTSKSNVVGKWGNFITNKTMNDKYLKYIDDETIVGYSPYEKAVFEMAAADAKGYYSVFAVEGEDGEDSYIIAEPE